MKILTRLEKSKAFWYLLGLSLLFFFLRLPSLIEPNWYGDEGIYQVLGLAINKGRMLYSQIWDNKPPLLYMLYAFFSGDQFQVRLFSLFSGLLATSMFFYLTQLLFKHLKLSLISTFFFVLLFSTPLLEGNIANAENFMLLPIITAGVLVYLSSSKNQSPKLSTFNFHLSTPIAGLLLGLAFLFKIVAIFDFAAFFIFLLITNFPERYRLSLSGIKIIYNKVIPSLYPLILGFLTPIFLTGFYFMTHKTFTEFTKAVFYSNVGYVGWKNNLVIPQGFLIFKLAILVSVVFFIFKKRKKLDKASTFIILWFAFSLFNTFFSGRPYTHYTLVTVPSFCLLIGLIFATSNTRKKFIYLLILLICGTFIYRTFKPNFNKSFRYYQNTISFLSGKQGVVSYQKFFDQKTPRDYEIASFIKTHTKPEDNIFLWGDSAQIYALSGKIPPGKYTVSYHIKQSKDGLSQTYTDLQKSKAKYIITLPETNTIPFPLSMYDTKYIFNNAVIYERNF